MDLISYLKNDHEIIRKFINDLESPSGFKIKNKIFIEMQAFIKVHFRAEESALYVKCLKSNIYEMNELALDGYEEHHLIEDLIYKIRGSRNNEELWLSRVKDFCQILDLHLSTEEADYFSALKNYFTELDLDRAAVIYLRTKKSELIITEQEQLRTEPDFENIFN